MNNYKNMMALRVEEIKEHNKLYEGLIYTYSVQDVEHILHSYQLKYGYKYDVLQNVNIMMPYIIIYILKNNPILEILEISKLMNNCGWYPMDIITIKGKRYHDKKTLKNFIVNEPIKYIIFRARFDIEIDKKFWPEYLYHLTHLKNLNKIKKYGLVPRSGEKLSGHEDHIYLYDISNKNYSMKKFAKDIEKNFINIVTYKRMPEEYKGKYALLKIDMEMQKDYTKLFGDPDLQGAYFTLDNISPLSISLDEIIMINKK